MGIYNGLMHIDGVWIVTYIDLIHIVCALIVTYIGLMGIVSFPIDTHWTQYEESVKKNSVVLIWNIVTHLGFQYLTILFTYLHPHAHIAFATVSTGVILN